MNGGAHASTKHITLAESSSGGALMRARESNAAALRDGLHTPQGAYMYGEGSAVGEIGASGRRIVRVRRSLSRSRSMTTPGMEGREALPYSQAPSPSHSQPSHSQREASSGQPRHRKPRRSADEYAEDFYATPGPSGAVMVSAPCASSSTGAPLNRERALPAQRNWLDDVFKKNKAEVLDL